MYSFIGQFNENELVYACAQQERITANTHTHTHKSLVAILFIDVYGETVIKE